MGVFGKLVSKLKNNSVLFNIAILFAVVQMANQLKNVFGQLQYVHSGNALMSFAMLGKLAFPICVLYLTLRRNRALFWVVLMPILQNVFNFPFVMKGFISIYQSSGMPIMTLLAPLGILLLSITWMFLIWRLVKRGELK